ncbi:MAG: PAS domain-containing protein [Myxococcales bacterium]
MVTLDQGSPFEAGLFLRSIAEASPSWIYVFDFDAMSVDYMNRSIPAHLGYGKGAPLDSIEHLRELVLPEDAPRFERLLTDWRGMADGEVHEEEHRLRHRDGSARYFNGRERVLARHSDGSVRLILGTLSDVTPRKQVEQALCESEERLNRAQSSEERFRELAENISECLWIASPDKRQMHYVSPAYETIWGRSCRSLIQEPASWLNALHAEDRERVLREVANQVDGRYDVEYRVVRPDGQVRWVHDRAFPVRDSQGRAIRIVGVVEDITNAKSLEDQFRQSQKMEAIGRLAGGVAHDFNNLLTVIGMQAESAQRTRDLPLRVQESLGQIRDAADRAANLTQQLLLFGRRQVMRARDLDVNELVVEASKLLSRVIGEDVRLELSLHPGSLSVHADRGMLDQIMLNLAINARDAMPHGGRLSISTHLLVVDEHPSLPPGAYVQIQVSDTGVGIPVDVLPRVFEPFFTTKEQGKGTGLGLATVFGIVQQHKGSIAVTSELGQGTTFTIMLPLNPNAPKQLSRGGAPPKEFGTGHETVLLVEDEGGVRRLVHGVLEQHGYHVLSAANGHEALRLWREQHGKIAMLVTDMVLPEGMTGLELARSLSAASPSLKVICTSGYRSESVEPLSKDIDVHFMQKPFSCEQLLRTMRERLDH